MSTNKRLTEVFESAEEIVFGDTSKFIFFSDCHRGDNSWADDFAHNQSLFFHALEHYYKEGFTYIELGDGDELWEHRRFADIRQAHSQVFWIMRKFHREGKFYLIWGNHDMERKYPKIIERTLHQFFNQRSEKYEPLLEDIKAHEGLVLRHSGTDNKIFLIHGHQVDFFNDRLWWLSRFFVRHVWRHLQLIGVKDPTSPAKNYKKRLKIERKIIDWVKQKSQMLIAGHTHRPRFPGANDPPYFNDGSCVHPRCITGIEIQNGEITLIKWWIKPKEDGELYVTREELVGPKKLQSYFKNDE